MLCLRKTRDVRDVGFAGKGSCQSEFSRETELGGWSYTHGEDSSWELLIWLQRLRSYTICCLQAGEPGKLVIQSKSKGPGNRNMIPEDKRK